ncbi:MAG: two component transcriptional regulator, LytTR family [Bacteroidetes bacterium]|nr:two component transcriptional regulator, LytTR family [Bacteroidota bacterium]
MEITAVVIEDEFKVRSVFIQLLGKFCNEIKVIGETDNVKDGYDMILLKKPDVVFLDIEMPRGNGFELLARFKEIPFEVIFVTSYGHYAIKAIRFSALDYLLKPVLVSDLQELPERIRKKIEMKTQAGQYRVLLENLDRAEQKTLVVNTKTRTDYIPVSEILYLKADGNYTLIHTVSAKFHVAKTLKEYDELLCSADSQFLRIHKACIINTNYIKQLNRGESSTVIMSNGVSLEISRRKKQELSERLNNKSGTA